MDCFPKFINQKNLKCIITVEDVTRLQVSQSYAERQESLKPKVRRVRENNKFREIQRVWRNFFNTIVGRGYQLLRAKTDWRAHSTRAFENAFFSLLFLYALDLLLGDMAFFFEHPCE